MRQCSLEKVIRQILNYAFTLLLLPSLPAGTNKPVLFSQYWKKPTNILFGQKELMKKIDLNYTVSRTEVKSYFLGLTVVDCKCVPSNIVLKYYTHLVKWKISLPSLLKDGVWCCRK